MRCWARKAKPSWLTLQPDLIISFGGPVTSKYIKQFLRSAQPLAHWRVQPAGPAPDTYQNLTHVLPAEPASFFAELASRTGPDPAAGYAAGWRKLEQETSAGDFPVSGCRALWRIQGLPAGHAAPAGRQRAATGQQHADPLCEPDRPHAADRRWQASTATAASAASTAQSAPRSARRWPATASRR